MTELKSDDKVTRKVQAFDRGKQMIVTVHPKYIEYKLLGERRSYNISHEAVFGRAVQLDAGIKL